MDLGDSAPRTGSTRGNRAHCSPETLAGCSQDRQRQGLVVHTAGITGVRAPRYLIAQSDTYVLQLFPNSVDFNGDCLGVLLDVETATHVLF